MKLSFKSLSSVCLFLSLLFNSLVLANETNVYKVIRVIDGDTLYIDFNNNGKYDKGEKVRINGIDAFETKNSTRLQKQAKQYNLTEIEALSLGYLGKEFAKKNLLNKYVKVEYSAKTKVDRYNRPLVSIYYNCSIRKKGGVEKYYEQEVLKEGLAVVYPYSNLKKTLKPYENIEKIRENAKKASSLVILNLKNNKYHKLNCPYVEKMQNYSLIDSKKINKNMIKAPCCHKEEFQEEKPCNKTKIIKDNGTIKIYYIRAREYEKPSYDTRTQAGKELINIINNANKTIDFAFYGLSNQDEILQALLNAQKRNVKIRGIIDLNINAKNDYPNTLESIAKFKQNTVKTDYLTDMTKKEKIDNKQVYFSSNYKFKGHIMHNKFCIVDNHIVWTGTANISSTGTGGYNENAVIIVESKNLADFYTKQMDEMYNNEHFHEDKKEMYTILPFLIGNIETSVYFSPSNNAVINGIIPVIQNAKDYIYVSMFLISHYSIAQELIEAKNRGVDVKLIVEANHTQQKYSLHEKLRKNDIPVKVENWGGKMHAKLAVVDDDTIILGSTNWTRTGFLYNDENLLILKNAKEHAQFLKNEFELSFKNIPKKWLYANPKPEGADSIGSCFDGIDNDHNGLIDDLDPSCFGVKIN